MSTMINFFIESSDIRTAIPRSAEFPNSANPAKSVTGSLVSAKDHSLAICGTNCIDQSGRFLLRFNLWCLVPSAVVQRSQVSSRFRKGNDVKQVKLGVAEFH